MPRFALLKHIRDDAVHYDLMLERGRTLKTWTLAAPIEGLAARQPAAARFDHPGKFLTYEGPLSEGNGRVEAVDRGEYESLEWQAGREWLVHLSGARVRGHLRLSHGAGEAWELGFLADPPAESEAGRRPAAPLPHDEAPSLMPVGAVARWSGLSREVVNSYAMFGLITESERTAGGRRLFSRDVLQRLKMIALLKQRGYTLRDIREIFLRGK